MPLIGIDPELSTKKQWQAIFSDYKSFLITISIGSVIGTLLWTPVTYTSFYLTTIASWSLIQTMPMTLIALVTYVVFLPIMGMIGDVMGHRKLMLWSTVAAMLFAFPLFFCLLHEIVIPFQIGFSFLAAAFGAAIHSMMTDLYPPSQRCRAVSLGFSIGIGTLGGASPFITANLVKMTGSNLSPAVYIILVACFGLWSMVVYRPYKEKTDSATLKLAA
jgi:MHS family proline/betaine transporter-like MFS transporter